MPSPLSKGPLCRLVAGASVACVGLLSAFYAFRAPFLTGLAEAWVVDEPATNASAIAVLGGCPDRRAVEAARLYHQGLAPLILYMDVKFGSTTKLGIVPSEKEVTRSLLLSNNVPETALVGIGDSVASTYDESKAVRVWIEKTGAKSILIPTDLSHTRRARWIFRKELKGTGAQIRVRAIQPQGYGVTNWWNHEEGLVAFQNEAIKFIYYWLTY